MVVVLVGGRFGADARSEAVVGGIERLIRLRLRLRLEID